MYKIDYFFVDEDYFAFATYCTDGCEENYILMAEALRGRGSGNLGT